MPLGVPGTAARLLAATWTARVGRSDPGGWIGLGASASRPRHLRGRGAACRAKAVVPGAREGEAVQAGPAPTSLQPLHHREPGQRDGRRRSARHPRAKSPKPGRRTPASARVVRAGPPDRRVFRTIRASPAPSRQALSIGTPCCRRGTRGRATAAGASAAETPPPAPSAPLPVLAAQGAELSSNPPTRSKSAAGSTCCRSGRPRTSGRWRGLAREVVLPPQRHRRRRQRARRRPRRGEPMTTRSAPPSCAAGDAARSPGPGTRSSSRKSSTSPRARGRRRCERRRPRPAGPEHPERDAAARSGWRSGPSSSTTRTSKGGPSWAASARRQRASAPGRARVGMTTERLRSARPARASAPRARAAGAAAAARCCPAARGAGNVAAAARDRSRPTALAPARAQPVQRDRPEIVPAEAHVERRRPPARPVQCGRGTGGPASSRRRAPGARGARRGA